MDNEWGGAEIWVSFSQTLVGNPLRSALCFRAMNSWKRLSLSYDLCRTPMISAPNIDRPGLFPSKQGSSVRARLLKDARCHPAGKVGEHHSGQALFFVGEELRFPQAAQVEMRCLRCYVSVRSTRFKNKQTPVYSHQRSSAW